MKDRMFCFPRTERSGIPTGRQSIGGKRLSRIGQGGQIIVEYVLLLAIAVMIAVAITKTLIGRDPGSEGFVIKLWQTLIDQIGEDQADDITIKKTDQTR